MRARKFVCAPLTLLHRCETNRRDVHHVHEKCFAIRALFAALSHHCEERMRGDAAGPLTSRNSSGFRSSASSSNRKRCTPLGRIAIPIAGARPSRFVLATVACVLVAACSRKKEAAASVPTGRAPAPSTSATTFVQPGAEKPGEW